jgi:GNAT superfamily N-acetyltransferase
MTEVTVTLASDEEARACLALLPEVGALPAELLMATRAGELVGAAALHWRCWWEPSGFPAVIHVLPAQRRRGVGRSLLAAMIDLARDETDGLWSLAPAPDDSAAARFMRSSGFIARRTQHHFEAAIEIMLADVARTADRLRLRRRVPETMRIVPLSEAPIDEVGRLVAELGGGPARAVEGLARRAAPEDTGDRSQVAMNGDAVAGVILWRVAEDGVAVVDARVVHPSVRGVWPNAVLLEAGLIAGQREGLTHLRFHCDDTVRDTLSLAKRCAAFETARNALYYYAIAAD